MYQMRQWSRRLKARTTSMGYRLYLGTTPRKEYEKMQKMDYPYLCAKYGDKGDDYVSVYKLVKELHGFGKYYDVDTSKYNPFFAKEEIQTHFSEDHDFWVVDREFLAGVIEKERKDIASWYEECKTKTHEELIHQAESHASEWRGDFGTCPYDLDLSKPNLVRSWKREYEIFDLIRIYKTFDFENNVLVYYGW